MSLLVGVDLGKTECRVRLLAEGRLQQIVRGAGAPGLAEPDGAAAAVEAVVTTVTRALHPVGPDTAIGAISVGAAGAEAAPVAAVSFASVLGRRLGVTDVAVASDALVSHVGAFGGAAGVALAVGTGSVAVGVSASGQLVRIDGSGPWLGDDGSGAWIGREALRAALREREQRGPTTALTEAAEQRYGDLAALTQTVARQGQVARDTAAFVSDVIRCALAGDAQAVDVLQRAALELAATTMAAVRRVDVPLVCVVGGLAAVEPLMEAWRKALDDAVDVVAPRGTALDGALMLAARRDLPHEPNVQRLGLTSGEATATVLDDVDGLETERVRPDLHDLDTRSPEQLVDLLLEAEASVPRAVAGARAGLADAVRLVAAAFDSGGRLIYVGAGTPGRLAAVDAAECPPTFGTSPDQVLAVLAGGQLAAVAAVEGAEDDAVAGAEDVNAVHLTPADVVVGITASGRTPYVLGALESARRRGAKTVAVVNNSGSAAADLADVTIELLTGPEVLSGSTRLKAGTSEKITLNALSTSAMILAGKSYGAWMVDVRASNEKLRRRARRIVRQATGVDDAEAVRVLELADWHTKLALVSILGDCDVGTARSRLDAARGRVREAVRVQQDR